MNSLHVDIHLEQSAKQPPAPCGDVVMHHRDRRGTTIILADGMGHGPTAFVAATMYAARLEADLRSGRSLRAAFAAVCDTIAQARGKHPIWAALCLLRIRHDGSVTVLGHESPAPVLLGHHHAEALHGRPIPCGTALVHEYLCHLREGESVLLVSDGITQAGLGRGNSLGIGIDAVADRLESWIAAGSPARAMPGKLMQWIRGFQGGPQDDCSAVLASCRVGRCVTLLTGPPVNEADDRQMVERFMASEGVRIVCGDTTSSIVARELGQDLMIDYQSGSHFVPPMSLLNDVDVVTEGAITLTQVVNLLDVRVDGWEAEHGVAQVLHHLLEADRVHIIHGRAACSAKGDLSFKQHGVLARSEAVRLIQDKLSRQGKYVDIDTC